MNKTLSIYGRTIRKFYSAFVRLYSHSRIEIVNSIQKTKGVVLFFINDVANRNSVVPVVSWKKQWPLLTGQPHKLRHLLSPGKNLKENATDIAYHATLSGKVVSGTRDFIKLSVEKHNFLSSLRS